MMFYPALHSLESKETVVDARSGKAECVKVRMLQQVLSTTCGNISVSPCQEIRKGQNR